MNPLDYYGSVCYYLSTMNNIKYQYNKTANDFSARENGRTAAAIFLAPIFLPLAIFWMVVDFLTCTIPDVALGTEHPPVYEGEGVSPYVQELGRQIDAARDARVEQIRREMFGNIS